MGNLIRDNKNILNFLVKKAYPYEDEMYVEIYYHYYTSNNISSYREAIRVYLNTTHDMFTWVDNKNNLLYCIDMNKLVRYNNMSMIMIGDNRELIDSSFNGKLLEYIIGRIYKSFQSDTLPIINRMLKYYGITATEYRTLSDFSNDTDVYNAFKAKLQEEVMDKSDECLRDFFDSVKLPKTIRDNLIHGSLLPVLRYNIKTQNVYIPMRKNIESVKLMSNTMNGKDEHYVYSLDDIMKGNTAINYRKKLTLLIRSNNHFDIPLGGAFD